MVVFVGVYDGTVGEDYFEVGDDVASETTGV